MPRGDKSSYSSKQQRQARHIEKGYEEKGLSEKEAARRAWATVNKQDGGARGVRRKKTSGKRARTSAARSSRSGAGSTKGGASRRSRRRRSDRG
jgi:hypothetical protein